MNSLDLSFSNAAIENIHRLLDKFRTLFGKEATPALVWIASGLNVETIVDSQHSVGFYDNRADIKEEDIFTVDGLEIALAVADEDLYRVPLIRTGAPIGAIRWT
jgi:hypothetical protein